MPKKIKEQKKEPVSKDLNVDRQLNQIEKELAELKTKFEKLDKSYRTHNHREGYISVR